MTAEITHLPGKQWNAHAALADAMSDMAMEEAVVILYYGTDGRLTHRCANVKNNDTLWMLEIFKVKLLSGEMEP